MPTRLDHPILSSLAILALTPTLHAAFSFNNAPAPGGFVQAGATPQSPGGSPWPGVDMAAEFSAAGADFHEATYVGNSSAMLSAAFSNATIANASTAKAGLGYAHLWAENDAPNNAFFPQAVGHGGWSETFTVSNPALTGQPGFMVFTLDIDGWLYAKGFAGSAGLRLTGFKDSAQLGVNPLFSPGGSDLISTDKQYGNWGLSTFAANEVQQKFVSDTVTFAVPIVFGTPFKLGIYARARGSMRSNSGVPGNSQGEADFGAGLGGLRWGGISAIFHGGAPVGGSTVTSGSGIDWTGPYVPPATGDLNGDGVVDGTDLGLLLAAWGTPAADLNGDGTTDSADLGLLLGAWT